MVHHHPAPAFVPSMSPLDDPALGQYDKAREGFLPQGSLRIMQGACQTIAGGLRTTSTRMP